MFHYFNSITNVHGDALSGFFVKAVDTTTGSTATLYADVSLTPIVSTSGLADAALVDDDGNVSFFVGFGTYHLDIYAPNGSTLVKRVSDVPMNGSADFLQFDPGLTSDVNRSVQSKLRDIVSIFDFGAVGDGSHDDSAALQAACNNGGLVILPPPPVRYNFATGVTVSGSNVHIICVGAPELYVSTTSSPLFTLNGSQFTFEGGRFTGAPTLAAAVFRVNTTAHLVSNIRIRNVFGNNLYHFYEDNGGSNLVFGAYLDTIKLEQHRGYGVNTSAHFGYFYINKFGVSRVGLSGTDYNYPAVHVTSAEGVFLDECAHDGTNSTSIQSGQHGFHFVSCTFVSIENTIPDHVGGNGILADTCGTVEVDGCDIPNVNLSAIRAINCTGLRIDGGVYGSFATGSSSACGVEASGCTSVEVPSAHASGMKADGFKFSSCGDINLGLTIARANGGNGYNIVSTNDVSCAAIQAISNGGAGFLSAGCNTVITTGMITRNNTGRGISSGASDVAIHHIGPRMSSNTAGNYTISDTTNRISLGVLSDNSLVNVTAPGSA